jgi:hypothetical protein
VRSDFERTNVSSFGSYTKLARLPRGVSTTTCTSPSSVKGGKLMKFGTAKLPDIGAQRGKRHGITVSCQIVPRGQPLPRVGVQMFDCTMTFPSNPDELESPSGKREGPREPKSARHDLGNDDRARQRPARVAIRAGDAPTAALSTSVLTSGLSLRAAKKL